MAMLCLALTVTTAMLVQSCNRHDEFVAAKQALQTSMQGAIQTDGDVFIRITANNEIVIAQTGSSKDTVEHIYVLALPKGQPITMREGKLGYSDMLCYKDKRAMVLHSEADNKWYFFGIDEDASRNKVRILSADPTLGSNIGGISMGYGLSKINGRYNAQKLADTTKKYASNLLAVTDMSGRLSAKTVAMATDDDAPEDCTSGGPGSSTCSISEGVLFPNTCSVTCNVGWYSCCNSSSVKCFCVVEPIPPAQQWQQCGGIGWTGPTYCQVPYICVYINPNYYQCQ